VTQTGELVVDRVTDIAADAGGITLSRPDNRLGGRCGAANGGMTVLAATSAAASADRADSAAANAPLWPPVPAFVIGPSAQPHHGGPSGNLILHPPQVWPACCSEYFLALGNCFPACGWPMSRRTVVSIQGRPARCARTAQAAFRARKGVCLGVSGVARPRDAWPRQRGCLAPAKPCTERPPHCPWPAAASNGSRR